jgi:short subunit dehydrogenase-like uncharacterized protein
VSLLPGTLRRCIDYGDDPRESLAASWGDVVAAWHSTGIPNIEVYLEATPSVNAMLKTARVLGPLLRLRTAQALLLTQTELLPVGPDETTRAAQEVVIVAEVGDAGGLRASSRLSTPDVYTFTARAAVAVAARVLTGCREPGFQTPARLLGPDFVLGLEGVRRTDVAARC